MVPKLRISEVSKSYGNVMALRPTSLELAAGEFLTLLGPSGSGKTTLLSLIAGLTPPDGGRIELDGADITYKATHQRGLGMVFQNYALFPHLNVAQNVAFGLTTRRLEESEIGARTLQALRMIRLDHLAHRLPSALSGGQQQRVALARALAYSPSVILMDEPLGALDRNLREEMKSEIARLHRELGTTVVYVTHDQEEALVLSTRICLMAEARVEQWGTPQDLYFMPASRYAAEFLGESNLLECRPSAQAGCIDVPALGLTGLRRPDIAGPGWLMVRPESIDLGDHGARPDATRVQARVGAVQMLGAVTRLHLQPVADTGTGSGNPPAIKALLRTQRGHLPAVGDAVRVACDLLAAHFIPAKNGAATS